MHKHATVANPNLCNKFAMQGRFVLEMAIRTKIGFELLDAE